MAHPELIKWVPLLGGRRGCPTFGAASEHRVFVGDSPESGGEQVDAAIDLQRCINARPSLSESARKEILRHPTVAFLAQSTSAGPT